jgi:hypothetical protein
MPIPTKVLTSYGVAMLLLGVLGLRKTWTAFRAYALPPADAQSGAAEKASEYGCFVAIAACLSVGALGVGLVVLLRARSG